MGSQQQYCLRWNNHQTNLLSVFDQLLQNESFVDVTLACGGLSLKAHKVVLSACSPYFQRLLLDNPCQHPIVILNHVGYDDLKALVDFMYKGEVNVQQDQLQALLKVAELLMIKGLSEVSPAPAVTINSVGDPEQPTGTVRTASAAGMTSPARRKRGRPRRSEDGGAAGTSISVVACGRVTMDDVDGMNDSHPGQLDVSVEELPSLSDDGGGATDGLMLAKVEAVDSESERSVARSHEGFNTDSEDVRSSNLESPSFLGMTGFSPSSLQSYNTTIPSGIMQQESGPSTPGRNRDPDSRLFSGPYPCHICHREMRTRKTLKKHLMTHDPYREHFPCTLCTRVYRRKDKLTSHFRLKHARPPQAAVSTFKKPTGQLPRNTSPRLSGRSSPYSDIQDPVCPLDILVIDQER